MKQEDFDRLKAVCEKEGFELINEIDTGNEKSLVLIGVKSKDIWEGVEFVQDWFTGDIFNRDFLEVALGEDKFQPSTESAYIEQLKVESFKRFGEIKEGDRFDRSELGYSIGEINYLGGYQKGYWYEKENDRMYFDNLLIYQKGKWATRVKERVKVNPESVISITDAINQCFIKDHKDFSKFLASKLEEYLNKD